MKVSFYYVQFEYNYNSFCRKTEKKNLNDFILILGDKELITQSLATNTASKAHNEDNSFTEYNYTPYINSYSAYHGSDETEMHKAWLHFGQKTENE